MYIINIYLNHTIFNIPLSWGVRGMCVCVHLCVYVCTHVLFKKFLLQLVIRSVVSVDSLNKNLIKKKASTSSV